MGSNLIIPSLAPSNYFNIIISTLVLLAGTRDCRRINKNPRHVSAVNPPPVFNGTLVQLTHPRIHAWNNPLHSNVVCRIGNGSKSVKTFSETFEIRIGLFIDKFGSSMKNWATWIQTSLVLVQWFLIYSPMDLQKKKKKKSILLFFYTENSGPRALLLTRVGLVIVYFTDPFY